MPSVAYIFTKVTCKDNKRTKAKMHNLIILIIPIAIRSTRDKTRQHANVRITDKLPKKRKNSALSKLHRDIVSIS